MYKAIHVIIQAELADRVFEIAGANGATGATLIHARGSGRTSQETILSVPVDARMALLLLIVPTEKSFALAQTLDRELHFSEPGRGVLFVAPLHSFSDKSADKS